MSEAARVCGRKTTFHTWQKRQIHPFLLLFSHDQDKFDAPLIFLGCSGWRRQPEHPLSSVAVREATWSVKLKLYRTATYLAVCIVMIYGRYPAFSTKMKRTPVTGVRFTTRQDIGVTYLL